MAFLSKFGNLLKQTTSKQLNGQISLSTPSLFQAIRCMSSSKLFVGGISYGTDDQGLRDAFSKYGEVIETRVIFDRETGRSRGFGFVTYTSSEEASSAIQALDGQNLDGRIVKVNYANDRSSGGGGFGGGGGGYGGGGGGYGGGGYGGGGYGGGAGGYGGNSGGYGGNSGGYGGNAGGYGGGASGGYGGNAGGYGDSGSGGYGGSPAAVQGGGYGDSGSGGYGGSASGGYGGSPAAVQGGGYGDSGSGGYGGSPAAVQGGGGYGSSSGNNFGESASTGVVGGYNGSTAGFASDNQFGNSTQFGGSVDEFGPSGAAGGEDNGPIGGGEWKNSETDYQEDTDIAKRA